MMIISSERECSRLCTSTASSFHRLNHTSFEEKPGLSGEITRSTFHCLEVSADLHIRCSFEIAFLLAGSIEPHTAFGTFANGM